MSDFSSSVTSPGNHFALSLANVRRHTDLTSKLGTLREKSSVICVGPCVTVAELACRSGAVRRAQMSF